MAKDKISKLNGKVGIRPGRNLNTASSMMHVGTKKKRKKGVHGQLSKSGDHHGIRKEVSSSSVTNKAKSPRSPRSKKNVGSVSSVATLSPKSSGSNQMRMAKSGTALLSKSEIQQLTKERSRDEKKRRRESKRMSKKMNGDETDKATSPRRKSSKKKLNGKKSSSKLVD